MRKSVFLPSEINKHFVSFDEENNLFIDDCGCKYDWGNKVLVSVPSDIQHYSVLEGTMEIGEKAFWDCMASFIELPESLRHIREFAFAGCNNIQTIVLPNQLESIDNHAFCCCKQLRDITIPNSIHEIKRHTFAYCVALQSVMLSQSLTKIDDFAFESCSNIEVLHIPSSVSSIGNASFAGCQRIELDPHSDSFIYKDNALYSFNMKGIYYCSPEVKEYVIPMGVTTIYGAFYECKQLTSISVPKSVTSICEKSFYNCSSLLRISIPDVFSISESAFEGCVSLTDVRIKSGCLNIEAFAFRGCTAIEEMVIPNSVQYIGQGVFCDCSALKRVNIPVLAKTECFTFSDCSALSSIIVPLREINMNDFSDCENLKEIIFTSHLQYIDESSFDNCDKLERIVFRETVDDEHLDYESFWESSRLHDLVFIIPKELEQNFPRLYAITASRPNISIQFSEGFLRSESVANPTIKGEKEISLLKRFEVVNPLHRGEEIDLSKLYTIFKDNNIIDGTVTQKYLEDLVAKGYFPPLYLYGRNKTNIKAFIRAIKQQDAYSKIWFKTVCKHLEDVDPNFKEDQIGKAIPTCNLLKEEKSKGTILKFPIVYRKKGCPF